VDEEGEKAGFATAPEEMIRRLINKGACFYPYHELEKIEKIDVTARSENGAQTKLYFTNGVEAIATTGVFLNIPQAPLLKGDCIVRSDAFAVVSSQPVLTKLMPCAIRIFQQSFGTRISTSKASWTASSSKRCMLFNR
jgi:hypothetical protein